MASKKGENRRYPYVVWFVGKGPDEEEDFLLEARMSMGGGWEED